MHIIETQQFTPNFTDTIFEGADYFRKRFETRNGRIGIDQLHSGTMLCGLFYQPSTRTRNSFEAAAQRLGMKTSITENAGEFSSAAKGETLEHTIRVMCELRYDVIVLRHHEEGAVCRAAKAAENYPVSLVNAGDGQGQHPTQSLIDLFTIRSELGRLSDLEVVIGGDLARSRAAHSLIYLLAEQAEIRLNLVSLPSQRLKRGMIEHLNRSRGVYYREIFDGDFRDALCRADIVYWIRSQDEYNSSADAKVTPLIIGSKEMKLLQPHARLLHPMPIVNEICREVDTHPQAVYFRQAGNGLFVRMSLLDYLLTH